MVVDQLKFTCWIRAGGCDGFAPAVGFKSWQIYSFFCWSVSVDWVLATWGTSSLEESLLLLSPGCFMRRNTSITFGNWKFLSLKTGNWHVTEVYYYSNLWSTAFQRKSLPSIYMGQERRHPWDPNQGKWWREGHWVPLHEFWAGKLKSQAEKACFPLPLPLWNCEEENGPMERRLARCLCQQKVTATGLTLVHMKIANI